MDSYEGNSTDPLSLHKYLYANADGVNNVDPSGKTGIVNTVIAYSLQATLFVLTNVQFHATVGTILAGLDLAFFFGDEEYRNLALATGHNPIVSAEYIAFRAASIFGRAASIFSTGSKVVPDIALGLKFANRVNILESFANEVGAAEVSQWKNLGLYGDDVASFPEAFNQTTNKVISNGGKIHFNLDNLNLAEAMAAPNDPIMLYMDRAAGGVGYTEWELQQIIRSEELWNATTFYQNLQPLTKEEAAAKGITFLGGS